MQKISTASQKLMNSFLERNTILHKNLGSIPRKTQEVIKNLYKELKTADKYINELQEKSDFYQVKIEKITTVSQIPRPKTFNSSNFHKTVREHIDQNMSYSIEYKFSLVGREITIHFIGENENVEYHIEKFNEYVKRILVWLYMIHDESSKKCSKTLTLFLYMSSLKKEFPKTELETLNETHVNTGFTYTCPVNSEIVIYRKEEWFKVFMHESFHNFALDFSEMNNDECKSRILNLFPVKSDVNLYESYAETWASIMNAIFCAYYLQKEENTFSHFLSNYDYFIHFERTFAMFQMVKVLAFMNLQYKNLYENNTVSKMLRETMYKEETNVLSYYVIKTILLENSDEFLYWCKENNYSLMDFKKTQTNLQKFCELVEKNYKTKDLLDDVETMQKFLKKLKKDVRNTKKEKNPEMDFFLSNTRMSICELG